MTVAFSAYHTFHHLASRSMAVDVLETWKTSGPSVLALVGSFLAGHYTGISIREADKRAEEN